MEQKFDTLPNLLALNNERFAACISVLEWFLNSVRAFVCFISSYTNFITKSSVHDTLLTKNSIWSLNY